MKSITQLNEEQKAYLRDDVCPICVDKLQDGPCRRLQDELDFQQPESHSKEESKMEIQNENDANFLNLQGIHKSTPLACCDQKEKNPNVITTCGHKFHKICILGWLNSKRRCNTCPICRAVICKVGQELELYDSFEDSEIRYSSSNDSFFEDEFASENYPIAPGYSELPWIHDRPPPNRDAYHIGLLHSNFRDTVSISDLGISLSEDSFEMDSGDSDS
ncbi:unnamed protein product [Moneuplotes crassus]|uniref:RING-type domain-containing protein n=1 Tax=Euplotes crassus TaxID=5936 RepID=A0AAD1U581_EUPCR|nr:unnamed protein product [Moneuplotes crassus]